MMNHPPELFRISLDSENVQNMFFRVSVMLV